MRVSCVIYESNSCGEETVLALHMYTLYTQSADRAVLGGLQEEGGNLMFPVRKQITKAFLVTKGELFTRLIGGNDYFSYC